MAQLSGHKKDLEDWKKGRDAVAELRAKVKDYIVPALNSVATKLVNEMTSGELSQVSITEEMEITVDGQDLETLSGAGKGCCQPVFASRSWSSLDQQCLPNGHAR